MNVLIDTPIWSEAFRKVLRPVDEEAGRELKELIHEQRALLLGPIRQELLSGIKSREHFSRLRTILRAFPDFPIEAEDYESAADIFSQCRAKGVQGSSTDFLICAIALRHHLAIYTTDNDFQLFARHVRIRLYSPRHPG